MEDKVHSTASETVSLQIAYEFGFVILTGLFSVLVAMWHGIRVESARKLYGIKGPMTYSDSNNVFNFIQRARDNFMENYPQFLFLLVCGGLSYPRLNAACGLVHLLGRIAYTIGYTTEDLKDGLGSMFMFFSILVLMFTTGHFAMTLLDHLLPEQ